VGHTFLLVLGTLFVSFALCGSLYITGFAVLGIRKRPHLPPVSAHTSFLVFVPAHNEGAGIEATLRSIQQANYPQDQIQIMVIADNCSDDTAERARACGVETLIRNDLNNRGKGHALSWAFQKAAVSFDMAVIIDADTEVDSAFFNTMNSAYVASLRRGHADVVLQGRYLFAKTSEVSSWFEQFTIASKAAENSFVYRPRTALGLGNLIQGNGFCISRSALSKVPFGAISIVEDAEYAVTLAINGVSVKYVDDAQVVSRMTRQLKDAATQRLRWASGTLDLLINSVPALLLGAIRQRAWRLAEMALMLLLTSRLILVYTTLIDIALLYRVRSSPLSSILELALAASLLLQSIYLYLVLRKADMDPVPFQTIAFMPFYFGFLGAMQLGAVLGLRKKQWIRTTR
jgi:cellulose synthase/poly-beta-1,6-N-acetylglucosamine synthase-like glycosyltransferase